MVDTKKCQWNGCNKDVDVKRITEHFNNHLSSDNLSNGGLVCKWTGCKYTKKFTTQNNLNTHFRNHFANKPWECKTCHNLFSKEDALKKHEEKHEAENTRILKEADKLFHLSEMRDEMLEKTEELLYERAYYVNLNRILKDEFYRDKSNDDSWRDYL
ncbi:GLIS2 [Enterospora canceri]|uniref:GLIS2 n=1 Tax=Enterospora canceri TaxID=1081671 RepID=A0A1Y1S6X1_9MICR|nr:GLIS2 [Enterospora canceri]